MDAKKKYLQQTNWSVFLILLAALFLIINYLAYRHFHRFDATATKTFSLSPQTVKALKELKAPLKVVVFLAPNDDLYGKVHDLLNSYTSASSKVQVEYIDPDRDKARVQVLAQKYKVAVANVVVFDTGDNSKYIEKDQMVDYDFAPMQMGGPPKIKGFKAEEAFTNAILDLLNPKKPTIYFSSGHGESAAGPERGIETLRDRLAKEGAQIKDWESLGKTSVPDDADLLVVAGPIKPFLPDEVRVMDAYLQKGGKALFLVDPILVEKVLSFGETGLEKLLPEWGVTLGRDIVVDPSGAVPNVGAQTFFAAVYSDHPIVRDLSKNKFPVLLTLAQSLQVGTPEDKAYQARDLFKSSPASWGKRDLKNVEKEVTKEPTDAQGPLVLAAAVSSEAQGKRTRIVVVGDSEIASDELLQVGGGNLIFCQNAVHWLLSQESRIAIPPKTSVETKLSLTANQSNFLFVLFVLLLPGVVVVAGVLVYMRRRR